MAKAPKKPKASASIKQWQNYDKKKTEYDKAAKAKDALVKKHSK